MAGALPLWFTVQDELLPPDAPYHTPSCFDGFDDDALFRLFHLTRQCLVFIVDAVRSRMSKCDASKLVKPADVMLMVALDYYAHGTSSAAVLQKAELSQASATTSIVGKVSGVVAGMSDQFVSFPLFHDTKRSVSRRIWSRCGIPDALGVLGPAHFKILPTPPAPFVNTRGHTSVATQIICDADENILSVEKCCVGSTYEQQMWDTSFRGREIEGDVHGPFWVIGGGGYYLSKHVLTPVADPANDKEVRFNEAHAMIYDVLRTTVGTMKARFKCLTQLGYADEKSLNKQLNVIKSCCVLHNIAKKFSVPPPPAAGIFESLPPGKPLLPAREIKPEVLKARQDLIDAHFGLECSRPRK